jgi:ESS family glutamate:Na+ symporter
MNSAMLTQLLYCFCVLSALLLAGALLRGIVPVFQKLFLPASVIGGFIGLLAGPIIWKTAGLNGGIPFPQEWISTWSALPGILIVPVVASTPLGIRFGLPGGSAGSRDLGAGKTSANVIKMFSLLFVAGSVQVLLGLIVREVFVRIKPELGLYKPFGYELTEGFAGGHGTAGIIGNYYKGLDLPYWEIAQGITTTTATFGLIGGMIIGIIAINIAARTGRTAILKKPQDIPPDLGRGFQGDREKQKSLGKETTYNSSIESISFHLAVILASCGIAYIIMNLVKSRHVPVIYQLPIWVYAIMVMYGVNFIIQKAGLDRLIDVKTKSRIAGVFSDYAITAAIASMPVQAILKYILPLTVLVGLGYILTYLTVFGISKRVFTDCYFERGIAIWGTQTGVFLTGLMLLKICDSDYTLPVLNDYSVGFSMTSLFGFILMPLTVGFMLNYGFLTNMLVQGGITLLAVAVLLFANQISKHLNKGRTYKPYR